MFEFVKIEKSAVERKKEETSHYYLLLTMQATTIDRVNKTEIAF